MYSDNIIDNIKLDDVVSEKVFTSSEETYRNDPAISQSDLLVYINKGFENFVEYKYGTSIKKESESMKLGSLCHCLILEPNTIEENFFVYYGNKPNSVNKKSFAYDVSKGCDIVEAYKKNYSVKSLKEDKIIEKANSTYNELKEYIEALESPHKIHVSGEMFKNAHDIVENYYKNNIVKKIYKDYSYFRETEKVIKVDSLLEYRNLQVKGKLDKIMYNSKGEVVILDIKTTACSAPKAFKESMIKYNYYFQCAFYRKLFNISTGIKPEKIRYVIVALQTSYPFPIYVYEIPFDSEILKEENKIINNEIASLEGELINFNKNNNYSSQTEIILLDD